MLNPLLIQLDVESCSKSMQMKCKKNIRTAESSNEWVSEENQESFVCNFAIFHRIDDFPLGFIISFTACLSSAEKAFWPTEFEAEMDQMTRLKRGQKKAAKQQRATKRREISKIYMNVKWDCKNLKPKS